MERKRVTLQHYENIYIFLEINFLFDKRTRISLRVQRLVRTFVST